MNKNLLELYLNRLDIQKQKLSLAFVQELQQKHLSHFTFNSIAVLLDEEISLDNAKIVEKIVTQKRGGYCFEHNSLMHDILKSLGFSVRLLVAKVLLNQDIDVPKTHRVTLLSFEGEEYLVDVGFGAYCPSFPIKISDLSIYDKYRVIKNEESDYKLEVETQNDYFTLYKFNLNNYTQADCLMGNFYSSNYKNAVFKNNLVVSLTLPKRTLSLRNRTYHKISKESTEVIEILSLEQLHTILEIDFSIPVSKDESKKLFEIIGEK